MARPYLGPRLWLDKRRGTWTILDGMKRIRTGFRDDQKIQAEFAIRAYGRGLYKPHRPIAPRPERKTQRRKGMYVIGFGPYIKIGITTDLDARLVQLQTPEKVQVHALLTGAAFEEAALHRRFAAHRINGEWFRREGELADWIDAGCQ